MPFELTSAFAFTVKSPAPKNMQNIINEISISKIAPQTPPMSATQLNRPGRTFEKNQDASSMYTVNAALERFFSCFGYFVPPSKNRNVRNTKIDCARTIGVL